MKKILLLLPLFVLPLILVEMAPTALLAQDKGAVVEEIVARVNNRIITLSDMDKAKASLRQEITQECTACTQTQIEQEYNERSKDLLRDLIDQSLLADRAKDLDIKVDTELVKRLDEVRVQNNLPSMEALQKAVESQGGDWEDYKQQLQDSLLTQAVIRQEVGSRILVSHDEVKKYYDAHKAEFNRPEQVSLAEIFLGTAGKSAADVKATHKKADDIEKLLHEGADFNEMARRRSEGTTAAQGGELGVFERGQLSKGIEDVVFSLKQGQVSDPIPTDKGLEILKVEQHFQAGDQPLDKVEAEITSKLFNQQMEPTLRTYLAQLREESYLVVKAGYVDTAAVNVESESIQEVSPTPDTPSSKSKKKKKSQG
jgi:peptidyl-prolyl cis-trans isomerase SurA